MAAEAVLPEEILPGLVPRVGDGIGKILGRSGEAGGVAGQLPDDALVCRGGSCSAERFENGSGATLDSDGNLQGASVQSAPGASLRKLSARLRHNRVGVSTVGRVRAAGGDVIPSGHSGNPDHCTLFGITPAQAQRLFTPTVRNPSRPGG